MSFPSFIEVICHGAWTIFTGLLVAMILTTLLFAGLAVQSWSQHRRLAYLQSQQMRIVVHCHIKTMVVFKPATLDLPDAGNTNRFGAARPMRQLTSCRPAPALKLIHGGRHTVEQHYRQA